MKMKKRKQKFNKKIKKKVCHSSAEEGSFACQSKNKNKSCFDAKKMSKFYEGFCIELFTYFHFKMNVHFSGKKTNKNFYRLSDQNQNFFQSDTQEDETDPDLVDDKKAYSVVHQPNEEGPDFEEPCGSEFDECICSGSAYCPKVHVFGRVAKILYYGRNRGKVKPRRVRNPIRKPGKFKQIFKKPIFLEDVSVMGMRNVGIEPSLGESITRHGTSSYRNIIEFRRDRAMQMRQSGRPRNSAGNLENQSQSESKKTEPKIPFKFILKVDKNNKIELYCLVEYDKK